MTGRRYSSQYGPTPLRVTRTGGRTYLGAAECQHFGCPHGKWDHNLVTRMCRIGGCECPGYAGLTSGHAPGSW